MAAAISGNALDNALLDGRYRVQAKIASGGTSTVYRASTNVWTVRSH
ncbi:hypothetical protein I553_3442 [Mycobacterium xenopi 4042]|uniref:Uncharacterized protein n=1 Tax=Mycobacterium xenopi 4042 TaxID=1299334 RepID=X7ZXF2_MYCXE|nr:hypothetical protein I553_3442 [Mycobacterium xenopi 4042]